MVKGMVMKTTKEKIEVMQAFEDGEVIQHSQTGKDDFINCINPMWDWINIFYRIKPKEPETDWSKVAIDTPVLVRDNKDQQWSKRYFSHCNNNKVYTYGSGSTQRTSTGRGEYNHCKLDKSAKSIINWIKNDGVTPDCNYVVARLKNGNISNLNCVGDLRWEKYNNHDIVEYAIIE